MNKVMLNLAEQMPVLDHKKIDTALSKTQQDVAVMSTVSALQGALKVAEGFEQDKQATTINRMKINFKAQDDAYTEQWLSDPLKLRDESFRQQALEAKRNLQSTQLGIVNGADIDSDSIISLDDSTRQEHAKDFINLSKTMIEQANSVELAKRKANLVDSKNMYMSNPTDQNREIFRKAQGGLSKFMSEEELNAIDNDATIKINIAKPLTDMQTNIVNNPNLTVKEKMDKLKVAYDVAVSDANLDHVVDTMKADSEDKGRVKESIIYGIKQKYGQFSLQLANEQLKINKKALKRQKKDADTKYQWGRELEKAKRNNDINGMGKYQELYDGTTTTATSVDYDSTMALDVLHQNQKTINESNNKLANASNSQKQTLMEVGVEPRTSLIDKYSRPHASVNIYSDEEKARIKQQKTQMINGGMTEYQANQQIINTEIERGTTEADENIIVNSLASEGLVDSDQYYLEKQNPSQLGNDYLFGTKYNAIKEDNPTRVQTYYRNVYKMSGFRDANSGQKFKTLQQILPVSNSDLNEYDYSQIMNSYENWAIQKGIFTPEIDAQNRGVRLKSVTNTLTDNSDPNNLKKLQALKLGYIANRKANGR